MVGSYHYLFARLRLHLECDARLFYLFLFLFIFIFVCVCVCVCVCGVCVFETRFWHIIHGTMPIFQIIQPGNVSAHIR